MQKPWSMYNKIEKLRIDDLKPEHVKIILLAIPNSKMGDWYALQEGDLRWQPIAEIPEFYEDVRQLKGDSAVASTEKEDASKAAIRAPERRRPLFEDAPTDADMTLPSLLAENTQTKERRSARRFPRMLSFKVTIANKSFECETVDVSMSGLSLDKPLPEWVPKSFNAELSLNRTSVKVLCARVDETKLRLTGSESWEVIRQWLAAW